MQKTTTREANYEYYLKVDVSNYAGEWISICINKILSHGKNLKSVVKEAQEKCKGKKFLLARVPKEEAIIF